MTLVTISIASYNNGNYVERCIESVLNQTYNNIEVLLVDDGSTDDTIRRVQRFMSDRRINIIEKSNGGLSSVRQMALEQAKGEYISFIDADDYLAPTYVERMLNKLIEDKSDICVCGTRFMDSNGVILEKETRDFACAESKSPISTTCELYENYPIQLKQLKLSDSWNKLYSLNALKAYGVEFAMPKGFNGTDTLFNKLVALHGANYSTVNDELYVHVIYSSSAVHRKKKNLLQSYQIIAERCINESRMLGIYEQTRSYIIECYHNNLFEVIIDEYNEMESMSRCLNRFRELKNINYIFSNRVDKSLLKIIERESFVTKLILFVFYNVNVLLPFILYCGKHIKKHTI